jgi:hypothetical protein
MSLPSAPRGHAAASRPSVSSTESAPASYPRQSYRATLTAAHGWPRAFRYGREVLSVDVPITALGFVLAADDAEEGGEA